MAEHGGHGGHSPEQASHGSESGFEMVPVIGLAVKMLKETLDSEGITKFLESMAEYPVGFFTDAASSIGTLFGSKGGGGGHGGGGHGGGGH